MGGQTLVVDGTGPTLSNKGLTAGTAITLTGGANDVTIAVNSDSSVFEYNGLVVRSDPNNSSYDLAADFVFGSQQLNDAGIAAEDRRMLFDKSAGAFCVGRARLTQWDTRGNDSFIGGGLDNIVTAERCATLGGFQLTINGVGSLQNTAVGGFANVISSTEDNNSIISGTSNVISGTATLSGVFCGADNDITGGLRHTIMGGTTNVISSVGSDCGMVGGSSNTISGSNASFGATSILSSTSCNIIGKSSACSILGSTTCTIGSTQTVIQCVIAGCTDCQIISPVNNVIRSVIMGGNLNIITANTNDEINDSGIFAGRSNIIDCTGANTVSQCAILGGGSNLVTSTTIGGTRSVIAGGLSNEINCDNGVILGGESNLITGGGAADDNVICGGRDNTIDGSGVGAVSRSVIVGGDNNTINSGVINSVIIGGNNGSIISNNSFLFTEGSAFTATINCRFIVKTSNGARFFTNDGATSGVLIDAGGNSWAGVSDINKKENLVELDHHETLLKVAQIPVYKYNMIGSDPAYVDIGPVAQDWHKHFGTPLTDFPVLNERGNQMTDLETGEPLYEQKPAKDPLLIEDRDMIGVLMSCVKDLYREVETLKKEIHELREKDL